MLALEQQLEDLVIEPRAVALRRGALLQQKRHQGEIERIAGELLQIAVGLEDAQSAVGPFPVFLACLPPEPAPEKLPATIAIERQKLHLGEGPVRPPVADGPAGDHQRRLRPAGGEIAQQPFGVVSVLPRHFIKTVQEHQEPPVASGLIEHSRQAS